MPEVSSRRGHTYAVADCVTCGEQGDMRRDDPATQRRWARKHAEMNPGHEAHLVTSHLRVYTAGADR